MSSGNLHEALCLERELVGKVEEYAKFISVVQGARDMSQVRRFLIQFGYGLE